jgi:hypothetical protein
MFPGAYVGALIAGIINGAHSGLPYSPLNIGAPLVFLGCACHKGSGGGSRVHSVPALGVGSQLTRLSLPCWGLTTPVLSLCIFFKLIFSIDTPPSGGQLALSLVC